MYKKTIPHNKVRFIQGMQDSFNILKSIIGGFPSGAVVKSPPANAGDMGSSPGPRRSHMLRSN